jgi:hypothetical protein
MPLLLAILTPSFSIGFFVVLVSGKQKLVADFRALERRTRKLDFPAFRSACPLLGMSVSTALNAFVVGCTVLNLITVTIINSI